MSACKVSVSRPLRYDTALVSTSSHKCRLLICYAWGANTLWRRSRRHCFSMWHSHKREFVVHEPTLHICVVLAPQIVAPAHFPLRLIRALFMLRMTINLYTFICIIIFVDQISLPSPPPFISVTNSY